MLNNWIQSLAAAMLCVAPCAVSGCDESRPANSSDGGVKVDIGGGRGINVDVDPPDRENDGVKVDVDIGGPEGGIQVDVD